MNRSNTFVSDTVHAIAATWKSFLTETRPDTKNMFFSACTEYVGSLLELPDSFNLVSEEEARFIATVATGLHDYSYTISE